MAGPLLQAVCARWAAAAGGVTDVPARGGGAEMAGWEDVWGGGAVKAPGRAADKAAGCYGGEAARVVDLCRARAVLLGGATGALRALGAAQAEAASGEVAVPVVRVKNWLADDHDPATTAGFRVLRRRGAMLRRSRGVCVWRAVRA